MKDVDAKKQPDESCTSNAFPLKSWQEFFESFPKRSFNRFAEFLTYNNEKELKRLRLTRCRATLQSGVYIENIL